MGLELNGFDDLSKQLDESIKKVHDFAGDHQVSFDDMFIDSFVQKYTKYNDMNEFFKAVGIVDNESFDKMPDATLDKHVSENTKFSTWEEMQNKALKEYVTRQIGF